MPGGDRGHLAAVAVVVARGERRRGPDAVATEPVHEPAGAHQLAVAGVGVPVVAALAHAVEADRRTAEPRDVGEERVVGPDAGVDDADDGARPAPVVARPGQAPGACRRAGEAAHGVLLDQRDVAVGGDLVGLGAGQSHREAVEGRAPPVDRRGGADPGEHRVLLVAHLDPVEGRREDAVVARGARPLEGDQVEVGGAVGCGARRRGHAHQARGRGRHRGDGADGGQGTAQVARSLDSPRLPSVPSVARTAHCGAGRRAATVVPHRW